MNIKKNVKKKIMKKKQRRKSGYKETFKKYCHFDFNTIDYVFCVALLTTGINQMCFIFPISCQFICICIFQTFSLCHCVLLVI